MKPLFIQYAKCGTCIKARKWLEAHNIAFDTRDIITQNPTEPELGSWLRDSSLPVQKFFNTSGLKYKELNLKDKVKTTPEDQLLALLASDGQVGQTPCIGALRPGIGRIQGRRVGQNPAVKLCRI